MIDKKQLNNRLVQKTKSLANLGDTTYHDGLQLTHIDNGADVLAVVHLDTVMQAVPEFKADRVIAPQLDDRLGLHIILDILPQFCKFDVLLTDGEEIGRSTAQHFNTAKQYNWMFQFDRHGTDAVMYDYHFQGNWNTAVDSHFKVGYGSFSDICYLTQLGVCGVNVGTGYHHEHTLKCYAKYREVQAMIFNFLGFWQINYDQQFDYDAYSDQDWEGENKSYSKWADKWLD